MTLRHALKHADKARAGAHDDRHLAADRADREKLYKRDIPATSIAFCSSDTWIAANCSASLIAAHALVMIRMGVRLPTNIASTCCSPSGIACPSGILAVKLYGPKKIWLPPVFAFRFPYCPPCFRFSEMNCPHYNKYTLFCPTQF